MKLKHLAFIVCVSQLLLLGIRVGDLARYQSGYKTEAMVSLILAIPMPVFFFMSGREAKTTDDPEELLGVLPPAPPLPPPDEIQRPHAILGGASLVLPMLGYGVGWMIGAAAQPHDGSGAAWAPIGLLWMLGLLATCCLIGAALSIASLWKIERWPILAIMGLVVNGGFLLGALRMICR